MGFQINKKDDSMNIEIVKEKILNYSKGLDLMYRYYSILIPIITVSNEPHLLFEVRSNTLRRQPGEICFPGGKKEWGETFKEAAIRETMEELNIKKTNIELFGELPLVTTHYNNIVYPFAAVLHDIKISDICFNKAEVSDIFTIPLDFFINTPPLEHYIVTEPNPQKGFPYHLLPNGEDYPWFKGKYPVYFYQYESYIIWGLTAKAIVNMVEILK